MRLRFLFSCLMPLLACACGDGREALPMRAQGGPQVAVAPATDAAPASEPGAETSATETPVAAIEAPAADPTLPEVVRPLPAGLSGEIVFQSDRDGRPRIYVLTLPAGTIRRVGTVGEWLDEEPKWSPDGRRIAFSSTRGGGGNLDIWVMDADGRNLTRLTDHPAAEQDPSWAADGASVFFTGERDGRGEIYRVWLADRRVERITSGIDRAIMPAASPDGKYLAYAAQTIMSFQIQLRDLAAGTTTQITAGGGACRPEWAPDSQELAFVRIAKEPSRLEVVRTSGPRVVLEDQSMWSYYPDYAPDGRHLVFSVSPEHHRGEDWDLAVMDLSAPGRFTKLTTGPGNDRVPDWK